MPSVDQSTTRRQSCFEPTTAVRRLQFGQQANVFNLNLNSF